MDPHRFDSLTRIVAAPASRRRALGALFGGGALGVLGRSAGPAMAQGVCTLDFVGTVRVGPTSTQVLTNDSSQPGEVRGTLSFGLDQSGALQEASLTLADGTNLAVVGQTTGPSLQFRVAAGTGLTIVGVGVGEQDIAACQGAIDGILTGPQAGDLGDWHAVAAGTATTTTTSTTSTSRVTLAPGTDTTTAPPPVAPTAVPPTTVPPPSGSGCGPGLTDCGGTCVDLSSDLNHCGACDAVCESGLVPVECRSGICERANCPVGITYCGAVDGCRDTMTDPAHCGGCQQPCADGECVGGVCGGGGGGGVCDLGLTDCGGVCTDLTDNANCGACGAACGAMQSCSGGICVDNPVDPMACAPGLDNCFGVCVDLTNNPNHCGGCGIPCPQGQLCQSKVCVAGGPACPPALTACAGICVNLMTDSFSCGACSNVCGEGQTCQAGVCAA